MNAPEFSRTFDVRQVEGMHSRLEPDAAEREALARRFGIVAIETMSADLDFSCKARAGGFQIEATGTLKAQIVQPCAVSAEDLPVTIEEPLFFRFVPRSTAYSADEEVELTAEELDEIEYEGTHFDVGEAVAQSLALAIDPFLTGPGAEEARMSGLIGKPEEASPFAALKGLKLGE